MFSYFERVAADLWDGNWDTIVHTRNACDVERLHLEAAILCNYGKSLSLRGTAETVRVTLAAARIDAETREARRSARVRQTSIAAAVNGHSARIGRTVMPACDDFPTRAVTALRAVAASAAREQLDRTG